MVCARSDGVLSGSWVHVPRPPRFHTRVFQPFRSRFPSRDLYGCHPYHRRGKKPRSRTADQIRPVWFHRSLYYRSVPIFRTNLWRYARRITMAMAIAAPPPIWCIPTPSERPVFRLNSQRLVRGFSISRIFRLFSLYELCSRHAKSLHGCRQSLYRLHS